MALARRLLVVLILLTALGGSAAFYATEMGLTGSEEQVRLLGWLVFGVMTFLSILMVVLIWRSLSRSLRTISDQLRSFEAVEEIGMLMVDERDELAEMVGQVNRYLTTIKSRFDQKRIERKELEIQARVAEAERKQTEAIIYSISEAVLVTNKYDELLLANQAAEKLFDFCLEHTFQSPIEEVLDDSVVLQLIRTTRENKSHEVTQLLERPGTDGSRMLSLNVVLSCILNHEEEAIGVVVVIHDMTAEKEIARLKDDFFSNVSHELKTPLASIRACSEMLADQEADNEQTQREFCEIIQEQAKRLNRLIDDILNISRIESGVLNVNLEPRDLAPILDEVIAGLRPQALEKQIRLERQADSESIRGYFDHDMMYHAIMNLMNNAIKYSYAGQTVTIRAGRTEEEMYVEVEDQGAGIPEESLPQVFDKFYRVRAHQEMAGGTGLGLHLVKQIVENVHGGEVKVKSAVGKGSVFRIVIPACPNVQPPAGSPTQKSNIRN